MVGRHPAAARGYRIKPGCRPTAPRDPSVCGGPGHSLGRFWPLSVGKADRLSRNHRRGKPGRRQADRVLRAVFLQKWLSITKLRTSCDKSARPRRIALAQRFSESAGRLNRGKTLSERPTSGGTRVAAIDCSFRTVLRRPGWTVRPPASRPGFVPHAWRCRAPGRRVSASSRRCRPGRDWHSRR